MLVFGVLTCASCKKWDNNNLIRESRDGNRSAVERLLVKGADVNAKNSDGYTALIEASENGRDEIVKLLLAHGAQVDLRSDSGTTPLMRAAFRGNKSTTEILLSAGADVSATVSSGNYDSLMYALSEGHWELARALLKHGAKPKLNEIPADRTALCGATLEGDLAKVQQLISQNVDVNSSYDSGRTPLLIAVELNQAKIVKILVDAGADPNAKSWKGRSLLEISRQSGNKEIIECLETHSKVPLH